jgi:double-strand break repair protein MRE11
VGILYITGTDFKLEKIPLKTVRPFITEDVVLQAQPGLRPTDEKGMLHFLTNKASYIYLFYAMK